MTRPMPEYPDLTPQLVDLRFGNRRVTKMYAQMNELRRAISAEASPRIQTAWDKCEEHLDFAYQMAAREPIFDAAKHFVECFGNDMCNGGTPAYDPTLNTSEAAHELWRLVKPEEHLTLEQAYAEREGRG